MNHATRLLAAMTATATLGVGTSALADGEPDERAARRAELQERFDTDGDGVVSEAERSAAREQLRGKREELIEQYDEDGDGRLSPDEREAAGLPQRPRGWRRTR